MAISKLDLTFVDNQTVINATRLNAIVSKINDLVEAANNGSSSGGSGGGTTPTAPSAPTITINGTSATISAVSGATIKYTLDGSTPSASVGTTYSSAITLTATCRIRAVAIKDGLVSSVSEKQYTHQSAEPTPTLPNTLAFDELVACADSDFVMTYNASRYSPIDNQTYDWIHTAKVSNPVGASLESIRGGSTSDRMVCKVEIPTGASKVSFPAFKATSGAGFVCTDASEIVTAYYRNNQSSGTDNMIVEMAIPSGSKYFYFSIAPSLYEQGQSAVTITFS